MMKKLFSLTLAMVTALGLMLPASAAEETTDEALARVTQAVRRPWIWTRMPMTNFRAAGMRTV